MWGSITTKQTDCHTSWITSNQAGLRSRFRFLFPLNRPASDRTPLASHCLGLWAEWRPSPNPVLQCLQMRTMMRGLQWAFFRRTSGTMFPRRSSSINLRYHLRIASSTASCAETIHSASQSLLKWDQRGARCYHGAMGPKPTPLVFIAGRGLKNIGEQDCIWW